MLLAALYFSEGAPIGWLWWALPTRLREAGVPLDESTALTAMLGLPWAFKWLWAPAVDALRGRRWGLRAWVLAAQVGMALALLPLALGADASDLAVLTPLLLAHAVCAATQDVAVDGFALRVLPEHERGAANGWMQVGMLAGRGLFGGLSLRAEEWIGLEGVVLALVGCCLASGVLLAFAGPAPDDDTAAVGPRERWRRLRGALAALVRSRGVRAGLLVALLGGAGFEAVGGTAHALLVDVGFTKAEVGDVFALPIVVAMAVGALLGGAWSDRHDRRDAARRALGVVTAGVLALALAVLAGAPPTVVLVVLVGVYLALGLLTAATYALFMDLCAPAAAATQFSAFMGVTNLCEMGAVWSAGRIAAMPAGGATSASYAAAWVAMAAVSLLAWPLIGRARVT